MTSLESGVDCINALPQIASHPRLLSRCFCKWNVSFLLILFYICKSLQKIHLFNVNTNQYKVWGTMYPGIHFIELLEIGSHKTSTQNVRNHPKNKSQTGLVWLERSFGRTMFIMWPYFGLIEEKTPLSHEVVCFQMPSIRYLSWGLLLHVNLNILVRNYFFLKHYYTSEGAISHNVLYSHQLSIAHYQVRFYAYKYF